jgi:hypothetical protein
MDDLRKAQLWRELARASGAYRSTLDRIGRELGEPSLKARADELTADIDVMLEHATSLDKPMVGAGAPPRLAKVYRLHAPCARVAR